MTTRQQTTLRAQQRAALARGDVAAAVILADRIATAAIYAVADMRTAADEAHEPEDRRYSPLRRAADRLAAVVG